MIEITNLSFSYPKHKVFSDISLHLEGGNVYGILGQNGVGKTTLLKILAGLLRSDANSCRVAGYNPYRRQPVFLQDVYYLPEDPATPIGSVEDYALNNGRFYPHFSVEEFFGFLAKFEINPKDSFKKLSTGQKKKALISYALALNTKLLLLDEPSNGMDIPSKALFRSIVSQHLKEDQVMVISTHQVRDLENLIDPIIILEDQGVLLHATTREIAEKLYFFVDRMEDSRALYTEETPAGYVMVKPNTSGIESKVNLEALFNAALLHKEWLKNQFKN